MIIIIIIIIVELWLAKRAHFKGHFEGPTGNFPGAPVGHLLLIALNSNVLQLIMNLSIKRLYIFIFIFSVLAIRVQQITILLITS